MIKAAVGATASQRSCPQFLFVIFSAMWDCGKHLQGLFWSKTHRKERENNEKKSSHCWSEYRGKEYLGIFRESSLPIKAELLITMHA